MESGSFATDLKSFTQLIGVRHCRNCSCQRVSHSLPFLSLADFSMRKNTIIPQEQVNDGVGCVIMLHNEIGKCFVDWPHLRSPVIFITIVLNSIHSSPFNKQISYALREKGNFLGSSSNTDTYLLPFGRLYSPLNKRRRKNPYFIKTK